MEGLAKLAVVGLIALLLLGGFALGFSSATAITYAQRCL